MTATPSASILAPTPGSLRLPPRNSLRLWEYRQLAIAALATGCIAAYLVLRFGLKSSATAQNLPLWIALGMGGLPQVGELLLKLFRRRFGSDLLAGISIVTAFFLHEYLADRFWPRASNAFSPHAASQSHYRPLMGLPARVGA
jgi:cation transport ATPase